VIDKRVAETYAKDSQATNKNALSDVYVKSFRYAADRIGDEGIIAFISNNSFIDELSLDGVRKHLERDFNRIYILDLKGNVRKDSMIDGIPLGEKHTIFGLASMVGIAITFLIRNKENNDSKIFYSSVNFRATRTEKFTLLEQAKTIQNLSWKDIIPNEKHFWLNENIDTSFDDFIPIGIRETKNKKDNHAVFKTFSNGVKTNRDVWTFNFNKEQLTGNIKLTIVSYNKHVYEYNMLSPKPCIDEFVIYDDTKISWSRDLKLDLQRGKLADFDHSKIRTSSYRPFTKQYLFFDKILNEEVYQFPKLFPIPTIDSENLVICVGGYGRKNFAVLLVNCIPDLNLYSDPQQSFPFYIYDEDGSNRRENITDWILEQFRAHYSNANISKWDIFCYTYAVLHHPQYREKYAANLKREFPRIPFAPDFWGFTEAGKQLGQTHVHYKDEEEFPLEMLETPGKALNWRVEKMRLSKDKTQLVYNDFLTLAGIPPETFAYRLGNRSALDWVIDQYQVTVDRRSNIVNDPNRQDDPQYIVRLIGQVITVSIKTMQLIAQLPPLNITNSL
jgi:predicted helicase